MESNVIRVGIGVIVMKDGKVLLGKRKGSHGAGEWAFPGGHLEYMESFEDCARRETREETGIEIKNIRFVCVGNIKKYPPAHRVLIGLAADWASGEPKLMEPEKCEGWEWFDLDNLPENTFFPSKLNAEYYQSGRNYFDA